MPPRTTSTLVRGDPRQILKRNSSHTQPHLFSIIEGFMFVTKFGEKVYALKMKVAKPCPKREEMTHHYWTHRRSPPHPPPPPPSWSLRVRAAELNPSALSCLSIYSPRPVTPHAFPTQHNRCRGNKHGDKCGLFNAMKHTTQESHNRQP